MDTRVLNEQRLEAAAQIKEAESAVTAARALLDQRQSEMRASEAVVKQRRASWIPRRNAMFAPTPSPSVAPSPPSSWMTIARPQRAPARRWNRRKPVSAARAAIEAARTSIIQAQTRVEAARRPSGGSSPILTIAS